MNLLIEGRLVCGHPLKRRPVTKDDPVTKRPTPVVDPVTNQQATEAYIAVAVPKAGATDWKQTPWGQQIHAVAAADWPNGEYNAPSFAWKITDGDSQVPNKVGKKPIDREGWPGHWVLHMTTRFAIQCYNVGHYDPLQQISDENAIKTGDYCRVSLNVKGNNPSQSPGVYLNPAMFELSRAGELILSESGPSAAEVFGGAAPAPTQTAAPAGATPPPPPGGAVQPAPDFLNPAAAGAGAPPPPPPQQVEKRLYNGVAYTRADLASWTDEQFNSLPLAQ